MTRKKLLKNSLILPFICLRGMTRQVSARLNAQIIIKMIDTLSIREESQYKNISEKIVHIIQQELLKGFCAA